MSNASDIDDTMTEALGAVEHALRTAVAEGLAQVLDEIGSNLEGARSESDAYDHAGDLTDDEGNLSEDGDNAYETISAAYLAGFDAAVSALSDLIETAKYPGWVPPAPA